VAATHHAQAALSALGFEVAVHVSPGLGHSIDGDGLRLGGEFLARRLG
jgi:phospholipase/carboxylesterase